MLLVRVQLTSKFCRNNFSARQNHPKAWPFDKYTIFSFIVQTIYVLNWLSWPDKAIQVFRAFVTEAKKVPKQKMLFQTEILKYEILGGVILIEKQILKKLTSHVTQLLNFITMTS